jgi:hypothetical protein
MVASLFLGWGALFFYYRIFGVVLMAWILNTVMIKMAATLIAGLSLYVGDASSIGAGSAYTASILLSGGVGILFVVMFVLELGFAMVVFQQDMAGFKGVKGEAFSGGAAHAIAASAIGLAASRLTGQIPTSLPDPKKTDSTGGGGGTGSGSESNGAVDNGIFNTGGNVASATNPSSTARSGPSQDSNPQNSASTPENTQFEQILASKSKK